MNSCLRLIAMLPLVFFSFEQIQAQSSASTDFYGMAADKQEICSNASSFMSEQEVERLIEDILAMQGLNNRFIVIGCPSVSNCVATLDKDKRPVILFNPTFLRPVQKFQFKEADLPEVSERDWSTLTILAHEIGHHLNNHLTNPLPGVTRQQQELEADRTAGFLIFLMGGALEQAQLAFKEVREVASYTHPARKDRLTALARGWKDAEARFKKAEPAKPVQNTTVVVPAPAIQIVKFLSDADGELYIDGEKIGDLEADVPLRVKLKQGEYALKMVSAASKTNVLRETLQISSTGSETVYKVTLSGSRKASAAELLAEGDKYSNGNSVSRDYVKALELYRKAAELGNSDAMNNIGDLYYYGRGVSESYTTALTWFQKAAQLNNPNALFSIGYLYEKGQGVSQDYTTAFRFYMRGGELGNTLSMNALGDMYYNGRGVTRDYLKAGEWYTKAANKGNSSAMNSLGDLYYYGYGYSKDFYKALEWFRKGADRGHIEAMNNMGYMYLYGYGTEKDYVRSVEWYRKSAEKGNATAMYQVGYAYRNGSGVAQDYTRAMEWYKKAADLGNASAMHGIGFLYDSALGVSQDYGKAMEWYRKAADKGNITAMYNIGLLYKNGRGVEQDLSKAREWFKKNCDGGDNDGCDQLSKL